ncbi:uncharacterized protein LOC122061812 [Macadamia integrifolia]|uniref:uncharacterized protein LOC122061812 n=1 Tax=Macadamia integrifolia TaxID=60698 RepID=UPI001C531AE9|nr:uncharacterized protein LOC122061812 [Macadamia integrifolia]
MKYLKYPSLPVLGRRQEEVSAKLTFFHGLVILLTVGNCWTLSIHPFSLWTEFKGGFLCIKVALPCLQRSPAHRPSMKEVVAMLSGESEPPHLPIEFSPSPPFNFPYKSQKKAQVINWCTTIATNFTSGGHGVLAADMRLGGYTTTPSPLFLLLITIPLSLAMYGFDPQSIRLRCSKLIPKVNQFVNRIIAEHRAQSRTTDTERAATDFVDVLLSLQGPDKLSEPDMIAVLWVSSSSLLFRLLICLIPFKYF